MTAKPRRYVRVRIWAPSHNGRWDGRWQAACLCGRDQGFGPLDHVLDRARTHARTCPAVRAATERDHLAAELATERADNSRLRADRAAWRTKAHQLAAELIEAREERT